ncbi:MAG: ATP-binding cassette domain-containing protein, partial [Limnohabitans sp.]
GARFQSAAELAAALAVLRSKDATALPALETAIKQEKDRAILRTLETARAAIFVTKPDASFEEIVLAAQTAGADEFIERMPQGYDTMLEENAANLSGGQKQRLSIARSLISQPRILILDEAASALDPESEAIFINNLSRIAVGRTVVMISHRLSTLVNANTILVMQNGQLMDSGPHKELLTRCETYQNLWNQQTSHI